MATSDHAQPYRKKLIEVDLPLDEINAESAREKSIRHGHPSTLHLWWARRPLAACRAVIFASLVDDPSSCLEEFPTEKAQLQERERLHAIIKKLVKWESTDEKDPGAREIVHQARYEIACSVARGRGERAPTEQAQVLRYLNDKALPIYDPFAGGGSIPLEAQRLGLRAVASDLNPIAVLINKALIEIPPKFNNQPPANPTADSLGTLLGKGKKQHQVPWYGSAGLAHDIRYYGKWMREQAFARIGQLYPKATLPDGSKATVIAWLWARTVPCSNPACGIRMPLMVTFQASKKDKNQHWIKPVINDDSKSVSFQVQNHSRGVPTDGTVNRNGATCIACNATAPLAYVREQSRAGNMGEQMTAIVAEGNRKRLFLSPTEEHIATPRSAKPNPSSVPQQKMPTTAYKVSGRGYGITHWQQLFTQRQLTALTTFSDLIPEVCALMLEHGSLVDYANSVCVYLALAIGRMAHSSSRFSRWQNSGDFVAGVFARQAIPMLWDFAEANPFCTATQNWMAQIEWVAKATERLPADTNAGKVYQANAATTIHADRGPIIVTDPPYYDNISYAELSDFFYVWLRPLLRDVYPDLFAGILVPIQEEMIAAPRFENPRERFEGLLNKTLRLIRERCSPEFPSSIFYAYKQQETEREGRASTGWETMLTALVSAGFQVVGTWPMRTERSGRSNALSANALASSVILVCRPRPDHALVATRRQFLDALENTLPEALDHLMREGHIAPVDLAQAAIGPGMEIYSRYIRVETISGEVVPVREALREINRVIADYHRREQGELDTASQFCMEWLRQHGYTEGSFGEAQVLSQAMNVSLEGPGGLDARRLLTAESGRVVLLPLDTYSPSRPLPLGEMTTWEGCFRMAYHLNREDGEGVDGAGSVARAMDSNAESVERLGRILYEHYDSQNDSANAVIFNLLVTQWQVIMLNAQSEVQRGLL